jgi:fructokinase
MQHKEKPLSQPLRVLSFGEMLWDIINGNPYIGGAPFNLAAHLSRMGVESTFVSAVGEDDLGNKALEHAHRYGIETDFIRVHPELPTGTVAVTLNDKGVPDFVIHENTAWDAIVLRDDQLEELTSFRFVAFYFGTLAQRSRQNRETLKALLSLVRPSHVFYDVNLRQHHYTKEWIMDSLTASSIVKCNDEEARRLSMLLFNHELDQEAFAQKMSRAFDVATVCITRGDKGAAVYHHGIFREVPGIKVEVVDTVGAGDAFSAGFLYACLSGRDMYAATRFAAKVGAFVASHAGAVPEYAEELKAEINRI